MGRWFAVCCVTTKNTDLLSGTSAKMSKQLQGLICKIKKKYYTSKNAIHSNCTTMKNGKQIYLNYMYRRI
jgi:Tfp pilus assembly protein PilV